MRPAEGMMRKETIDILTKAGGHAGFYYKNLKTGAEESVLINKNK